MLLGGVGDGEDYDEPSFGAEGAGGGAPGTTAAPVPTKHSPKRRELGRFECKSPNSVDELPCAPFFEAPVPTTLNLRLKPGLPKGVGAVGEHSKLTLSAKLFFFFCF